MEMCINFHPLDASRTHLLAAGNIFGKLMIHSTMCKSPHGWVWKRGWRRHKRETFFLSILLYYKFSPLAAVEWRQFPMLDSIQCRTSLQVELSSMEIFANSQHRREIGGGMGCANLRVNMSMSILRCRRSFEVLPRETERKLFIHGHTQKKLSPHTLLGWI